MSKGWDKIHDHPSIIFIPAILFGGGLLLCAYLLSLTFIPDAGRFCELFMTDCLSVITSDYSKISIFSSSSVGLAYFVFQLLILFSQSLTWHNNKMRSPLPLFLISGGGALVASCYYLSLFLFVIPEECIACYGVHFINILFFLFSLYWLHKSKMKLNEMFGVYTAKEFFPICIAGLLSVIVLLSVNIAETRFQLGIELQRGSKSLSFAKYRHKTAPKYEIEITRKDTVFGNKAIAFHEIILIYKQGCSLCQRAKEKLIPIAEETPDTIYLVLKNYSELPTEMLNLLKVKHVPMVFVDGREAEGWDLPGFFDEIIADCGC